MIQNQLMQPANIPSEQLCGVLMTLLNEDSLTIPNAKTKQYAQLIKEIAVRLDVVEKEDANGSNDLAESCQSDAESSG